MPTPIDIKVAIQPIVVPPGNLNGLFMVGSFFLKIIKDMDTINHATTKPSPPASTIHSRAGRPKNGATVDKTAIRIIALWGVRYFGCNSTKAFGNIPAFANAYIALQPPT